MTSQKKVQKFEVIAVILTALGKFLFYDILDLRFIYILIMFSFWGVYVGSRIKKDKGILIEWGFRLDNFFDVLKVVLPFGIFSTIGCFAIGYFLNTIHLSWHIIPIIILYPLFGTLQQFLIMALVAGNLQKQNIRHFYIILTTSFLFAILHFPEWWLILGTFVLALFYSFIYLKQRNLYVLGLFHGLIGAVFYYTVVAEDPYLKIFGSLI